MADEFHAGAMDLDKVLAATNTALQYEDGTRRSKSSVSSSSFDQRSILSQPEFDDSEFDVPAVTLPSLEDILADDGQGIDPFDVDVLVTGAPEQPAAAVAQPKKQKPSAPSSIHGSVLRHSRLKNLAAQLHTASAKVRPKGEGLANT